MKVIRVSAHVGGPGSRRYDRCTDPFATRGERRAQGVGPKTCQYSPKRCFLVCLGCNSQTLLLPVAISDGRFIPLLDSSGVKASIFTWAALNYERVGGREFLITKTYQSRLEKTVDIHRALLRRWVEPEAPMSRLPSFVHHTEDKSMYHAGELCVFSV